MGNDNSKRMFFEGLEERRMMSGTPVVDPGPPPPVGWPVVVNGTSGNDVIKVYQSGLSIVVTKNGVTSSYPSDQTSTISVYGLFGNDLIDCSGMGRKVYVEGGSSVDTIMGGSGNDTIYGAMAPVNGQYSAADWWGDSISGGDGNDLIFGAHQANSTLNGGAGNDTVYGGSCDDVVDGGAGNDVLSAGDGANKVYGGLGDDTITTEGGNDLVWGGYGNDQIAVGAGDDWAFGEDGSDSINGGANNDTIDGGTGNDTVMGGAGPYGSDVDHDLLVGGDGTDTVSYKDHFWQVRVSIGSVWNNGAWYYDGNGVKQYPESDYVGSDFENAIGGHSADIIIGTALPNNLDGGPGDDSIFAGAGNDTVNGSLDNDQIFGEAGNDLIDGYFGDDTVFGGDGNDTINGNWGDDFLHGDDESDVITGDWGKDHLFGGHDNDALDGGLDNDVIVALGGGFDTAIGGSSTGDFFWVGPEDTVNTNSSVQSAGNVHVITFFSNTEPTEPDGQDLEDPVIGDIMSDDYDPSYSPQVDYMNIPLYRKEGPTRDDVIQQALGDCYFVSALSGIAGAHPEVIQRSVADLGDGTYAVRFFSGAVEKFYRVDAQLPVVMIDGVQTLAFAGAGGGTLWAPIMEKAFCFHRSAAQSYAGMEGGTLWSAYDSFHMQHDTDEVFWHSKDSYMTKMRNWLANGGVVTVGTDPAALGCNLATPHAYTVVAISADLKTVTLRNPWGVDDDGFKSGPDDGYITISVDEFDNDMNQITYASV
jgi:Ca2+-binding RTX toxin-like protein